MAKNISVKIEESVYHKHADDLKKALLRDEIVSLYVYGKDGEPILYRRTKEGKWNGNNCSVCKYYSPYKNFQSSNFCPNCGAKLKEGEK